MASVHDVAAHILKRGGSMSTMKLQKLAYYSQAWHLVWAEAPLFDDEIQAWMNGPVVRTLYDEHKGRFTISDWPKGDSSRLTDEERANIDAVFDAYGKYSGQQLSELSHSEEPWKVTRGDVPDGWGSSKVIDPELIQAYYSAVAADAQASAV